MASRHPPSGCYRARREPHSCSVMTPRGTPLHLEKSIRDSYPYGFEWGYPGAGPAHLAFALLCDWWVHYSGVRCDWQSDWRWCRHQALEGHREFRDSVIVRLPHQWDMHPALIGDWVQCEADRREFLGPTWDEWWDLMQAGGWVREWRYSGGESCHQSET